MNVKRLLLSLLALMLIAPMAKADKGMWLLNELNKQNIQRMKELGFKLDPTMLFSNTKPGIANSVVIFGRGCTGVTVSPKGLIFTNHHCGYEAIQSQSTVDHDYLRDGFVSHTYAQELPIDGLTVKYLESIIDVTPQVLDAVKGIKDEMQRLRTIQTVCDSLVKAQRPSDFKSVDVYPFYENNVYYLITYKVFRDVRMVFAPPSSLGKFGGDTDNWMWPRQTCDFSVFRVYAGADNQPAKYSADNKPYVPPVYSKISMKGVRENDFAMTIGYPGSTDRYLSSWGVENKMKNENDPRILVRGAKQAVWKRFMNRDQAIRIQYSSKYAQSANYWKNAIGMNKGLKRLGVVAQKRALETKFAKWVAQSPQRQQEYGWVLDSLKATTLAQGPYLHDFMILYEASSGFELAPLLAFPKDKNDLNINERYKDFNTTVGRATLPVLLQVVKDNVKPENLPSIYRYIEEQFNGDYDKYAAYVYGTSVVVSKENLTKAMEYYDALQSSLPSDPAYQLQASFSESMNKLRSQLRNVMLEYQKSRRVFFAGLRQMQPHALMPSDANFTMRMSYGSVKGYDPFDAAHYDYYTTQNGILQKADPDNPEFDVQPEILSLLRNKTFGTYSDKEDNNLRTCFLSTNDITGGNSGSPVYNGEGQLIGLAFDGNWEAMSGDIEFEPNLQRTIVVDIRYVLWVIDVWGKDKRLINELTLK